MHPQEERLLASSPPSRPQIGAEQFPVGPALPNVGAELRGFSGEEALEVGTGLGAGIQTEFLFLTPSYHEGHYGTAPKDKL